MTKVKGIMMSSEALEPAGFISQYIVDGNSYITDKLDVDSNDDIYLHNSASATIGGVSNSGQIFAKIESDPVDANFGLITNVKMIKMSSANNASIQNFCISGSNVHGAQLNYINTAANTRNYATHFRTDLNFGSLSPLNSWHFNEVSTWGASNASISKLAPDGSNGVYLGAQFDQGSTWDVIGAGIVRVSSSGGQYWKQFIVGTNDATYRARILESVHANSNGYVAVGVTADGSGTGANDAGVVGVFNSSGTQQWLKWFGNGNYWRIRGVHIDSSQNVYICADGDPVFGESRPIVVKLNSSGTLQWSRRLNLNLPADTAAKGWGMNVYSKNIVVDGSDIYIATKWTERDPSNNSFSLASRCGLMKMDTSGNFNWYREFTNSSTLTGVVLSNYNRDKQLEVDSQGNVIFAFRDGNTGAKNYLMKIPQSRAQSGAFTGTYHGEIRVTALGGSVSAYTTNVNNWPTSATSSPYALNAGNASLTTVSPSLSTNTTSYLY